MKKFWKALGIAALAAVVPVRYKKDEETGKKTFQSLLWKMDVGPTGDGDTTEIGLDLMEGLLTAPLMDLIDAKKESALFTDDPEEAVLFADNEPEAAVVDIPPVEAAVEAAKEAAGAVMDAAEEAADAVAEAVKEEAVEADFDPEF